MEKLAIIIPTFNRCILLTNLLRQLGNIDAGIFNFKIFVVNDGCTDETRKIVESKFNDTNLINTPGNYWYTKSINTGIKEAMIFNPSYFLLLNDDIELDKNYFILLGEAINKEKNHDIIGSLSITKEENKRILFSGVTRINWLFGKMESIFPNYILYDKKQHTGMHKSIVLPGRGLLIRKKVIEEIGMLDEHFPQYHSDFDYALRAVENKLGVYICYDAVLYSYHKATSSSTINNQLKFWPFIKSFRSKFSRRNICQISRFYARHAPHFLLPVTITLWIIGEFYAFLFKNHKV